MKHSDIPRLPEVEHNIPKIAKPLLSPYQERIIRVLSLALRPLTTRQISKYGGMNYTATRTNLESLTSEGKIRKKAQSNRIYWYIEVE